MCGIAGLLYFDPSESNLPQRLQKMATTMKHRGPDDEGYVLFSENDIITCGGKDTASASWHNTFSYAAKKNIEEPSEGVTLGLAHRRLSVIDLSAAGHQPMCNDDATIWITCNGEIYNYIELRSELEALGAVFKTRSDIEVLIKAYEQWDMAFTEKLNGMWAFVIFDKRKNILLGCRDRFGVKPFYFTLSKDLFAFASEQKALLTLPMDKQLNEAALFDYLVYGKVEQQESGFYQHIRELMPSHYFIYDLNTNQFSLQRYYQLYFSSGKSGSADVSPSEVIAKTKEKIFRAVDMRLRSDVPVGFCLSGGIDSSSIVGVAQSINQSKHLLQLQGSLYAFTATHGGHDCDESRWASQVVSKHHLDWHQAPCTANGLFDELETIIHFQDSPLFSTSTYAQNVVMRSAKHHGITILLDGQGGDELFAGYVPFYIAFYFELLKQFRLGRLGSEWFNLKHSPLNASILLKSMGKVILDHALPGSMKKGLYKRLHKETAFITQDFFTKNASAVSLAPDYSSQSMNSLLHDFFTRWYLKNLLRWEDRCSMQYSIESRTPFADDTALIKYVFSLPASMKIQKGWSKYLLRLAMQEVLPRDIYSRTDKLGFATPQSHWLMQENQQMKAIIQQLSTPETQIMINTHSMLAQWNHIFASPAHSNQQDLAWRTMNYL
ncbi:MAG: asparagine synthase (glutamine-hydrolyzing), partial [Bacteroidota bacterium]